MKIAMLAAANSPHTVKWANELAKAHEVTVFSMPSQKDALGELTVTVQYLAQDNVKACAKEIKTMFAGQSFDVVNAFGATTYGYMAALAKLPHVLLTVLGPDIFLQADTGLKGWVKKSIKNAQAVCAAAPNMVTRVKQLFKKEKECLVTPFGLDLELFTPAEKTQKESLCFGSTKLLEEGCGVDLVLQAFAKYLKESGKNAVLKIAGDGALQAAMQQQAQSLGIADRVTFAGRIKNAEIPAFWADVDIAVQMNGAEAFGVCAVEAMACGVPVVSADTVGASEYILNGVTGYLVKAGNVARCCECMMDLSYASAREKMGQGARQDMEERFAMANCATLYEKALEAAK